MYLPYLLYNRYRTNSNQTRDLDLQGFGDVVKRGQNLIKIGMHSSFGWLKVPCAV